MPDEAEQTVDTLANDKFWRQLVLNLPLTFNYEISSGCHFWLDVMKLLEHRIKLNRIQVPVHQIDTVHTQTQKDGCRCLKTQMCSTNVFSYRAFINSWWTEINVKTVHVIFLLIKSILKLCQTNDSGQAGNELVRLQIWFFQASSIVQRISFHIFNILFYIP